MSFWGKGLIQVQQVFGSNSSSQQVISLIIPHCGSGRNPCLLALLNPRLSLKWNSQGCDVLQVLFCGPKSVIKWFYKTTPTVYVFSRLKPGQTASRFSLFFTHGAFGKVPFIIQQCAVGKVPLWLCRFGVWHEAAIGAIIPSAPAASSLPRALAQGQIEARLVRRCAAAGDRAASYPRSAVRELCTAGWTRKRHSNVNDARATCGRWQNVQHEVIRREAVLSKSVYRPRNFGFWWQGALFCPAGLEFCLFCLWSTMENIPWKGEMDFARRVWLLLLQNPEELNSGNDAENLSFTREYVFFF